MTKATARPASRRSRRSASPSACGSITDELRRFALHQLIRQEEEREKIARLLHDDLGQSLLGLNLGLYRLSCLCRNDADLSELVGGLRALLARSSRAVRRITHDFRPLSVHGCDLHALLLALSEYAQAEYGIHLTTIVPAAIPLGRDYAVALRRLLQLALNGVVRDGLAVLPAIRARREGDLLSVEIRDEGNGVHEPRAMDRGEPPAFAEMREWIRILGGELGSHSADHGTIMAFALPLPE